MEQWDILDREGNTTGRTVERRNVMLCNGDYHLVVHIWILSNDGNYLIQRRSRRKKLMPGEWAATGGAAIAGEDSFHAAARELFEELSIKSDDKTLKYMARMKRKNSFVDVWFIKVRVNANELRLQENEVSEVKWVSRSELEKMISSKCFHNYGTEYFKTVFDASDRFMKEEKNEG